MPAAANQHEPALMLWAWETPEDLTAVDTSRTGVAFLAREVLLGKRFAVRPRYQPLRVAPGTWLMAVVRIESSSGFQATPALVHQTAAALVAAAAEPNVRGLQVDFDATASERDFYAAVLRETRRNLPAEMPLSVTALVSWCGPHSWLAGLGSGVIDEAVPMYFRMGGPATTRAAAARSQAAIAEPVCSGAVGVATDEAWPAIRSSQRVYIFNSGAWTKDSLARLNKLGYESLKPSL